MSNKVFHFSNSGISSGQRFYLKDDVSGIFVRNLKIDSNFPVVASNLVYNTGDQNISGAKNFYTRPTVNGTGVLLIGEASNVTLPDTIVYTTGNQTIGGFKNFPNGITSIDEENNAATTLAPYVISIFDGDQNTLTLDVYGLRSSNEALTIKTEDSERIYLATSNQNRLTITPDGNIGIGTELPSEALEVNGNIKASNASFNYRPTVNGTGVLLSGEAINFTLRNNIVYTTGNQSISGIKTFYSNVMLDSGWNLAASQFIDSITLKGIRYDEFLAVDGTYSRLSGLKNSFFINYVGGDGAFNRIDYIKPSWASQTGWALYCEDTNADPRGYDYFFINYSKTFDDVWIPGPFGAEGAVTENKTWRVQNYNGEPFAKLSEISGFYTKANPSGFITSKNVVYTTGNQTISGTKTFDIFPIVSGNKLITGIDLSSYATNANLFVTGSNLDNKINTLSGVSVLTFGDQSIYGNKTFLNNISISGSGIFNALDLNNVDVLSLSGVDINIKNGNVSLTNRPTVNGTGVLLSGEAANITLPQTIVYTTGAQTISGIKTFFDSGIFSNAGVSPVPLSNNPLSIVGSGNNYLQVNIQNRATGTTATADLVITANNGTDSSYYIDLGINNSGYNDPNFSNGGAYDGYLFVNGGSLDIGTQTTGTNIEFHIGGTTLDKTIARITSSGLNIVSGNLSISGNSVATSANLFTTGSVLDNKINALSGYVSGISLGGLLPSTIVYTTGDQLISGNKTFLNNVNISGTGNFNNVKVSNIDKLFLSGIDIVVTGNSSINLYNPVYISGKAILTGVNLSSYATNANLFATGSRLDSKINSLSGVSVLTFGDQNVFGNKSFISNIFLDKDIIISGNIRASGTSYFNDNLNVANNLNVGGIINNPTLVLTKGKQIVSGEKTFANNMSINAYTGNGYDTSNLDLKLNIGGDINENAGIQIDAYGTNPSQILMRRARGIPTGLSGVLKDDVLFNLQARGYVSGLNAYSTNSRAAIRLIAAEDWVGGAGYNGQGTYILFRSTNIGSTTAIDKVIIGSSGINVLNGNIYISGNPVVDTASDQVISGRKTFTNSGVFSLSGAAPLSLPNNPLSIVGSANSYLQLNIQNRTTGTDASADLVITANNGTDSSNYINLGINNSGYSNSNFTNGTGYDGYLFIDGGDLDIGTRTPGKVIEFHAGGTTQDKTIARIDSSGINIISGTYRLNNVPYNTFTINFLSSNANLAIGQNYISNVGAGYSATVTERLVPMIDACTARKASISLLNAGAGNNIVGITGLFINTSSIPPQTGIINASISALAGSNQYTFTGAFATPININAGDNVACSLNSNNTAINVRTFAAIYCYN